MIRDHSLHLALSSHKTLLDAKFYKRLVMNLAIRPAPTTRHAGWTRRSPPTPSALKMQLSKLKLDAEVAHVAQAVGREERPSVHEKADPLRGDLDPERDEVDAVARLARLLQHLDGGHPCGV